MLKLFKINPLKSFLPRFARVLLNNLLYLLRQADKFHSFFFTSAKVILFWVFIVIIMLILIEN